MLFTHSFLSKRDKHIDLEGLPYHGPQDEKGISEDVRLCILSLLHVEVSVETIMAMHKESVEKQGGPCNRDDMLTSRYVRGLESDFDDAVSVGMCVESHYGNVFFYKEFSDFEPFVLGIQIEWKLQQMLRFGNRGLVASDSRLDNKAIPVAWLISPHFSSGDTLRWMRALYNRARDKDPTWKLVGFIVDDPLADILSIREVFQCSVLISFWRVGHAWHKNLVKKCSKMEIHR